MHCFAGITKRNHHLHHDAAPSAWISLTISCHSSQSSIASGRSSGLHPISAQCCCMLVQAGCPAFSCPCEGVHRNTSRSPLLQQSNFDSFHDGWVVGGPTAAASWGASSMTCSILLAAFLCSCHQAFSPYV